MHIVEYIPTRVSFRQPNGTYRPGSILPRSHRYSVSSTAEMQSPKVSNLRYSAYAHPSHRPHVRGGFLLPHGDVSAV